MTALNRELADVFGPRLLPAKAMSGAVPTVGALRGRVLALLSGDGGSRGEYRHDVGYNPAVAMNKWGQIVEVHDSGSGTLWYWTGTYRADGRVTWQRHGRYDNGRTPAVALNDEGYLVEVHQSENNSGLWYRVGRLDGNGEISWPASKKYDEGTQPTVSFLDADGTAVREVHRSQNNNQNWEWQGSLNRSAKSVLWSGNRKTDSSRYPKTVAVSGSNRVSVWTEADGASPSNTLRYATDRIDGDRIRYDQVAFVEYQSGDGDRDLANTSLFYAADAGDKGFITSARASGHMVRAWDFDDPADATTPPANQPATNSPWAAWYQSLTSSAGAVE
jgi:hypothetical protein